MSIEKQESGVSLRLFVLVAALVVVGAFVAVWFAIPGPDTEHRLVSPSGAVILELAELCTDNGCNRVAIFDAPGADGGRMRTGCPLDLPGREPLFRDIEAQWAADESAVTVSYGGQAITFARAECTLTS